MLTTLEEEYSCGTIENTAWSGTVVSPKNGMVIVSSNHIRNGLNPTESVPSLLARLCDCANKDWALAYIESTGDLHVWPRMISP